MIERFNFYDIYGYLIPGLAFILLMWLPFGISDHMLPDDKLSAAVAAIAVGYVLGHLLVAMAGQLISGTTARAPNGQLQYPSAALLDKSNSYFSQKNKEQIAKKVKDWFDLDVAVDQDATGATDAITGTRQTAFFQCRPIVNKVTGYPEQFQGLYSMMSGLTVTFGVGFFYVVGWAAAALLTVDITRSAYVGLALSLGVMVLLGVSRIFHRFAKKQDSRPWDFATLCAFSIFLLSTGYLVAVQALVTREAGLALAVIAALCVVAALRCSESFRYFATEFAAAVWRYLPEKTAVPAATP